MLNYGAAAQIFFGYDKENLVNAELTDEQKTLGTQELPAATNQEAVTGDGLQVTASVTLKNKVTLGLTVMCTTSQYSNAQFVICDAETGEELERIDATSFYGVAFKASYDNVGAREMRALRTIALYDGDTQISQTLTWNVESFVASVREDSSASAEKVNIANALLTYGDSAAAYLEASGQ